jgi:hypothetical protein
VGEIGITTGQFYYGLKWWEIQAIIRGYNKRARGMWSAIRWHTYNIMSVGMKDIKSAGIIKPTDLLMFPWEDEEAKKPPITDEERQELVELLNSVNKSDG